jgi:Kef-type K+ transport system membrane component KefB
MLLALSYLESAVASEISGHSDPIAPVLLALFVVLIAAKLGSELFERLSLPAVLGELIAGIVLGSLVLINPGWSFLEPLRITPIRQNWALILDSLARLGVIILLFEVGLESTVQGMMKVGKSAFFVAVVGVIAPFSLGYAASWIFIKEIPAGLAAISPGLSLSYVHLFIGAVLCATSVGHMPAVSTVSRSQGSAGGLEKFYIWAMTGAEPRRGEIEKPGAQALG